MPLTRGKTQFCNMATLPGRLMEMGTQMQLPLKNLNLERELVIFIQHLTPTKEAAEWRASWASEGLRQTNANR